MVLISGVSESHRHINGEKESNISIMSSSGYSIETLKEEISKCEIVCSNCHRLRTFNRQFPQDRRQEI